MHHEQVTREKVGMVSLNDDELTVAEIVAVSRHLRLVARFAGEKRKRVERLRRYVEENWFGESAPPRYGFNTGIGSLKNIRIAPDKVEKFQECYVKSHSVGVGEPLPVEIVRGAMLLQANALAKGYSGVRALVVDKLIEMLNKEIHPVVPEQGSLGASGDLAPLTHIAAVLVGEPQAEFWVGDSRVKVADVRDESGVIRFKRGGQQVEFETIRLQGKEAVSLTNATAVMLSVAVHLVHDAEVLLKNADTAAALSLEAMMCEKDAFAEPLHELRRQSGQIATAKNIRNLTAGSRRMTPEARQAYFNHITQVELAQNLPDSKQAELAEAIKEYKFKHEFEKNRVQDAYSLRCIPQVHGACKDAFRYVREVVEREIGAVTDNPVIFAEAGGSGFYTLSGGNFHGEPLALALDFLSLALAETGSISERRVFRLLSPRMSFGLPRNLTGGEAGLNSGLMMAQYTAAQLVSENKILAHPASVDSIPTSDNQEDHVSMGLIAARKARQILKNAQNLLAIEYLAATQALHLSAAGESVSFQKFPLGAGTAVAFHHVVAAGEARAVNFGLMREDEFLHAKIASMKRLCASGEIVAKIEERLTLEV